MTKLENNYYKTSKDCPIENFYEVLNSNNFNFLRKGITADNIESFPREGDDYDALGYAFDSIQERYSDILGDGGGSKNYMILAEMSELQTELEIVSTLCLYYQVRPLLLVKIEIERWGYTPDNLDKAFKKLKGIEFRMSIIKSKNPDIFDATDKKDEEKIEYDLYKDVVALEDSLGNGMVIDVKKVVVERWANYLRLSEEKYKRMKKSTNGK